MDHQVKIQEQELEKDYPGITESIDRFRNADIPYCVYCGSDNVAIVQAGIVGRTLNISRFTKKIFLVPNRTDEMGKYYCRNCQKFFN